MKIPTNGVILAITILLAIGCFIRNVTPSFNGDFRSLFPNDSPTLSALTSEEEHFGRLAVDVVVVSLQPAAREALPYLEDDLLDILGVVSVTSPLTSESRWGETLGLISADGQWGKLLVEVDATLSDKESLELNRNIAETFTHYPELKSARSGLFFLTQHVTELVTAETYFLVPLAGAVLLVFLATLFGSIRLALEVLLAPAISIVWVALGYTLLGRSFGPISQLLPSFLLAVGTSYSVHVAVRILEGPLEKRRETMQELARALALAALTTTVGLFSLVFLDARGVSEFALSAACGVLLAAALSIVLTAPLAHRRKMAHQGSDSPEKTLYRLSPEGASKARYALPLLALALLLAPGLSKLAFSTRIDSFLPAHSSEREEIERIEALFPGSHVLSVSVKHRARALTVSELEMLAELKEKLLALSNVERVIASADFLGEELLGGMGSEFGPSALAATDGAMARMLIGTPLSGRRLLQLKAQVEKVVNTFSVTRELSEFEFSITSVELILAEQAEAMLAGLVKSVVLTFALVFVLLVVTFRSLKVACIGMLPNALPLASVYGLSGYLFDEMNVGTAIAGVTALSIAVDDTFHLLLCWREKLRAGNRGREAAVAAIKTAFGAMLTTSLVLASVFFTLSSSELEPVRHYGGVIGAMLLVGLVADIVVLPFLLGRTHLGDRVKTGLLYLKNDSRVETPDLR